MDFTRLAQRLRQFRKEQHASSGSQHKAKTRRRSFVEFTHTFFHLLIVVVHRGITKRTQDRRARVLPEQNGTAADPSTKAQAVRRRFKLRTEREAAKRHAEKIRKEKAKEKEKRARLEELAKKKQELQKAFEDAAAEEAREDEDELEVAAETCTTVAAQPTRTQ